MKISVIIVTKNRFNDLERTINEFYKQTYKNFEIIIVDNQSTDETKEKIPQMFPDIKYFWFNDNFEIRGLNIALGFASGDIVWRGDDDSFPESIDTFQKVVNLFSQFDDIDIIATEDIEIYQGNQPWEWYTKPVDKINVPDKGYISNTFHGTGVAIKKKVVDKIGGFWGFGFEELDFSARAIIAGFNIRYYPNIKVLHYSSINNRPQPWRYLKFMEKYVKFRFKYLPLHYALFYTFLNSIIMFVNGIYNKIPLSIIAAAFFSILPIAIETRVLEYKKLDKETLNKITFDNNDFKILKNYLFQKIKVRMEKWRKK